MKQTLALIAFIFCIQTGYSQIAFGVKAGGYTVDFNPGSLILEDGGIEQAKVDLLNAKFGFQAGIMLRLTLLGITLQPELMYSTSTTEFTVEDLSSLNANEVIKQKWSFVDIPLLVGLKLGPLRALVGPEARLLVSNPTELLNLETFKQEFSNARWGYQAGLGLDIGKIMFDVRYQGSFKKWGSFEYEGNTFEFDDRASSILFQLGYKF